MSDLKPGDEICCAAYDCARRAVLVDAGPRLLKSDPPGFIDTLRDDENGHPKFICPAHARGMAETRHLR